VHPCWIKVFKIYIFIIQYLQQIFTSVMAWNV